MHEINAPLPIYTCISHREHLNHSSFNLIILHNIMLLYVQCIISIIILFVSFVVL